MSIQKIKKAFIYFLPVLILIPAFSFVALGADITIPGASEAPIKDWSGVRNIIQNVINFLRVLFFAVAFVFALWAGFAYLKAGGDSKKVEEANKKLIYAAVAFAVGLIAGGLKSLVGDVLKTGSSGGGF